MNHIQISVAVLCLASELSSGFAQDLTVPRSFYGFGDPSALAVDAAESRAYVGESAAVTILDLAVLADPMPPSAILARVPVDASVVGLTLDEANQRLLIAGGSFGLWSMELGGGQNLVQARDDVGAKVCFETALYGTYVVAVYAALNNSEMRVYDRATLSLVASAALPIGQAYALAMDGTRAYVAMGNGGLVRVELVNPLSPIVQPGPVFPTSVFGEPARVRDVAISGTRLYAAADALGLVSLRTTLPWGPAAAYSTTSLSGPAAMGATGALYAHHVFALGSTVAVGANSKAGREADGGPFTSYGPMNYSLAVGGVSTPAPLALADALVIFQQTATGLSLQSQTNLEGPWRELILRTTRIYEEHMVLGFRVRSLAAPAIDLASYRGVGATPAEALVSLRDPDVILSGQDSAGTIYAGLLDISDPDAIATIPGTAPGPGFGLWFDALWLDVNPNREFFVGNGADNWRLHRFDATNPGLGDYWELLSPDDPLPGSNNGRNYFLSELDGDLLLLTRAGTRFGFVGYSRPAVEQAAAATPVGAMLNVAPLWQLETHLANEAPQAQTWRTRVFLLPGGQRIAAIASGFNTSTVPLESTRAQVMLFDVSAGITSQPTFVTRILCPNTEGNAVAVATRTFGTQTILFVADFGYGIHTFDVSNPAVPVLIGGWPCPTNDYDGRVDHSTDLELDVDPNPGIISLYVTAWRRGLVRLDVTNPSNFNYPVLAERDTPGLPYGFALRSVHGAQGLVVADHQAGLRLHGQFNRPPTVSIAPAPAGGLWPMGVPISYTFSLADPDGITDLVDATLSANGGINLLPLLIPYFTSITPIMDGAAATLIPLTIPSPFTLQLTFTATDTFGATGLASSTIVF